MRDKSLRTGERQVAANLHGIEFWHRWRYNETLQYIYQRNVLDMCCGVGYGTFIMSQKAKSVIGVDDSAEAIQWANEYFKTPVNSFICSDFLNYNPENKIDVIVSFEAVEHIQDTRAVFDKFKKFNPELIVLSTPHLTCPKGGNKFHYKHYGMDELVSLFVDISYKVRRAELRWLDLSLCNFLVVEKC